jgi:hypothetical protein
MGFEDRKHFSMLAGQAAGKKKDNSRVTKDRV